MYKTTAELKNEVKDALRGRWSSAIKLSLVPIVFQIIAIWFLYLVLGTIVYFVQKYLGGSSMDTYISANNNSSGNGPGSYILNFLLTFLTLGVSFTFLDVLRQGKKADMSFKQAFRLFNGVDFVPIFLINILMYIFQTLWSMLFIIPGIVKTYAYSQSNFIYKDLSEHKDVRTLGATSFITESRQLMNGHKGRLFWLDITFIGWYLLVPLTGGLAAFYVTPYVSATKAAFYNDLSKGKYLAPEEESSDEWTNF
ncbi:hypothetical protein CBF34_02165 [Vagococcus penaei]|uniref:Uncharacterized protein n=1 Tax=Vagococcus penaei TaxID=633807 RepID=A0A1Q2D7Z3_9ENTE|nr:DUF975 family protein [Vagococcus penaei]AQP54435.1 hypothetical protein BW732_09480 [Vagococcus penaei]RSU06352.1 hypothetical protein CBF34_02165 [Vagococcus penaei]